MKLIIQAGHAAWVSRSGRNYPVGGGAPGEAQWAWALAHLMAARLAASGVESLIVGQWYNLPAPPEATDPADLFLSLHYDAAVYGQGLNTGCFADRWQAETMPDAADAFIRLWSDSYPLATGIPLRNERRNANTSLYYAYSAVTVAPAVLIEHGCGSPVPVGIYPAGQDSAFLHNEIETVADANTAAVLAWLMERGLLPAEETEHVSDDDTAVLQLVHDLGANFDGVQGWVNRLAHYENVELPQLRERIQALEAAAAQIPAVREPYQRIEGIYPDGERHGYVVER